MAPSHYGIGTVGHNGDTAVLTVVRKNDDRGAIEGNENSWVRPGLTCTVLRIFEELVRDKFRIASEGVALVSKEAMLLRLVVSSGLAATCQALVSR